MPALPRRVQVVEVGPRDGLQNERVIVPTEPHSPSDLMNILFGFLAATAERSVDRFHLPPSRTLEIGYPVRM